MKPKVILIIAALTLLGATSVQAKTGITGTVFGKAFSTMKMSDGAVPYSVTIDDINSGEACDNNTQTCMLKGFSWSDVVGWTDWDGLGLQTELGGAKAFPDEYMAKINYRGSLAGFIWGEKFGWIQLSACSGLDSKALCEVKSYCAWSGAYCEANKVGPLPKAPTQTDTDWGVYADFCPLKVDQATCESIDSNHYCNWDPADNSCVFDKAANPNGQPLRGFAWSQYLGWIKFTPEAGDLGFNGALTNWYPDLSPPIIDLLNFDNNQGNGNQGGNGKPIGLNPSTAWIPNDDALGTIHWMEFAKDENSAIDLTKSFIAVNTDASPDFTGCPLASKMGKGNLVISQDIDGKINLSIPKIGLIGTPPYGFCKYTMGGALYNASGFGFYFGPEGAAAAAVDGVDVLAPAPNIYKPDSVTLYVRAGDLSVKDSSLTFSANSAVADGKEMLSLTLSPRDIAGNPIVSVKTSLTGTVPEPVQANWVRDVKLLYDLNGSDYDFDRIDVAQNFANGYPIPVQIQGELFKTFDPLRYPADLASIPDFAGNYLMDVVGFAPSKTVGNKLELGSLKISTVDALLPAISPSMGPWNTSTLTQLDSSSALPNNPLPHLYDFSPALEVTKGKLDADFIVIGQPVKATFSLVNHSTDPLASYALDQVLDFKDTGGIGAAVLELSNINLDGLSDTTGRTDPDSGITRYGLLSDSDVKIGLSEGSNPFHSTTKNYHPPVYEFNSPADMASGVYQVNGKYYVSPGDPCLASGKCPPMDIDRSDLLNLPMAASGQEDFTFGFTPSQYIGQAINAQVTFDIHQLIGYHAKENPFDQFALYPAPPKIDSVDVKSIGLGTKGVVGGGQIFETVGGRDLNILTTTSAADLRGEIRKNVAVLSRTITPCSASQTLTSLPMSGACVSLDKTNKTVLAVYTGPGTLVLGGGGDVEVPDDYKYTLILLNGASLSLKSNLSYKNNLNNSLGMIVMEDEKGKGGNVYLDPTPTNMVGLLYAEGSLLSSKDSGKTFYYGAGSDANDLKNQLFWQGSIVSSNTIGAGANKIIPTGVDCKPWNDDVASCALAYDLDFLRRFITVHAEPEKIDFSPASYLFSGGGQCSPGTADKPGCVLGGLPTTISLKAGSIDVQTSKSIDTFFIEKTNRPVPLGFSSGGGLSSSQEIR